MPSGVISSGSKVRAVCHCGYTTTPRVSEQRALEALHSEHGRQGEICDICHRDRHDPGSRRPFAHLRVITDPDNGDELLVCADDQQACNDTGRQLQVQLDRAAFDAFGIEMPRPRLRLIEGWPAAPTADPADLAPFDGPTS